MFSGNPLVGVNISILSELQVKKSIVSIVRMISPRFPGDEDK